MNDGRSPLARGARDGADSGRKQAGSLRCFVAVRIGRDVERQLRALAQEVRRGAEGEGWRVAWTRPEGWHVTLKFLGDVEEARVGEVQQAVGRAAGGVTPFTVEVAGLLVLPPRGQPRVLAVGLDDDGRLGRLAERVDEECEGMGFARETRRFTPHLTLGRVRSTPPPGRSRPGGAAGQARPGTVPGWIERLRDRSLGGERIESVELIRSSLSPGGSVYTTMAEFALGAGGVAEASLQ